MRQWLPTNSFDTAIDRMISVYDQGHRVVVSFSGGKDSTVVLEVCVLAATATGRLPVEVVMRDEEIMFPGTFEYCERVAQRDEIDFHWVIAHQPVINIGCRADPFVFVFDPQIDSKDWVRQPPPYAYTIRDNNIQALTSKERFPPPDGCYTVGVTGLRADESPNRIRGIHSSNGYLTKPSRFGFRYARPIYDMSDGGVWKAILENRWDYNSAYDVMNRFKVARRNMRIAPPTQRPAQLDILTIAARAHPRWFDRVANRLPGIRSCVQFGRVACEPRRDFGEPWSVTFQRECIDDAPDWVADRCARSRDDILKKHASHSSQPFPEARQCVRCGTIGSWMRMSKDLYLGDPFSFSMPIEQVEPEFFRAGAGTWGGGRASW